MRFLATEKLSEHKYKTPEGYLVCVDAVLSRTGKQQYRRAELFGDSCERADELIDVDRLEADVFDEKAMASFENKPICIEHPDEDVNVANHNDLAVGFVRDIKRGTDNGQPVMLGTLIITDENAIDLVESGEYNELSCGYDCDVADDKHPMQKNIRGNHVALCQHGRAGNARIVDSVKDSLVSAEKLEIGMRINYRGKIYTVKDVTSNEQYKGEYDLLLKADDGSQRVLETGESDRFTVIDNTSESKGDDMKDAIEKNFEIYVKNAFGAYKVADWSAVSKEAAVKEFLAANPSYRNKGIIEAKDSTDSKRDGMKDMATLKDDEYVQLPRGRFKLVAKTKEELEKEGYGYHHSDNGYSVYVKNNRAVAIKDAVYANDADYEQWTKQGWRVVALYKDGGRIHAIVERKSGDFVVALGYNTSTGEWGQGRYVSTFAAAVDTLNEEKPGAVPIRDAKLAKKSFEVSFVKNGVTYVRNIKADSLQTAIKIAQKDAYKLVGEGIVTKVDGSRYSHEFEVKVDGKTYRATQNNIASVGAASVGDKVKLYVDGNTYVIYA